MRSLTRILPVVGFALLIGFLVVGLLRDRDAPRLERLDRPMPVFALPDLFHPETRVTKDDLLGDVTLVNVFGSWCVACLQEHDTLLQLSMRSDIRLIGLNWRDEREAALDWLERRGNPYDQVLVAEDGEMIIALGVSGAPETFLVDHDGVIRWKFVGPLTPQIIRDHVDPALADMKEAAP